MKPYYEQDGIVIYHARCEEVLPLTSGIHSVVTDPPYGLLFMGKAWDYDVPRADVWQSVLQACLPGAYLLSFFGSRTYHRGVVQIEDAGWEIRDSLIWLYASGFPKSLDVSKAIDKEAGAGREKVKAEGAPGYQRNIGNHRPWMDNPEHEIDSKVPATFEPQTWQGWGTALKPAHEPIVLARKPFNGTVAENVQQYGTGAINVDGCRIEVEAWKPHQATGLAKNKYFTNGETPVIQKSPHTLGRWPANVAHDGSAEVMEAFAEFGERPGQIARVTGQEPSEKTRGIFNSFDGDRTPTEPRNDAGSAARFFFCGKASKNDREEGLENAQEKLLHRVNSGGLENDPKWQPVARKNHHPTVKPTELMRWLCRLITPPAGIVLDPFMGSGSTGKAAILEGFRFVGIEQEEAFCEIAVKRIQQAQKITREIEELRAIESAQMNLFAALEAATQI